MTQDSNLWWVSVLRGVVSIVFGIMVLAWPAASVYIVAVLFASFLLAMGIADIITGFMGVGGNGPSSVTKIILGVLEAGSGAYLLFKSGSGLTLKFIGILAAVNLIVMAFVNIALAFMQDVGAGYRWAMVIAGLLALFVGSVIASSPGLAAATLIWVFGVFGLFLGPLEIVGGLMLRKEAKG